MSECVGINAVEEAPHARPGLVASAGQHAYRGRPTPVHRVVVHRIQSGRAGFPWYHPYIEFFEIR